MSKIPAVDSKSNARKREFSATTEAETEITTSLGNTEHHGKQSKLEESEIDSEDPNEESCEIPIDMTIVQKFGNYWSIEYIFEQGTHLIFDTKDLSVVKFPPERACPYHIV